MHGHYAYMSAESYISYCDGHTSTKYIVMVGTVHSHAQCKSRPRPTMRCIRLVTLHYIAWTHFSLTWGVFVRQVRRINQPFVPRNMARLGE